MRFTKEDILNLDHIYKINLVNSISGFKSANLIATQSTEGIANVGVFSSVVHLGSEPPLFGFVLRPTTVKRDTYNNIKATGFYTINHITTLMAEDAHHTSASYDALISEFDKTDLEAVYISDFKAPFVKQSPVKIALRYVNEYPIQENGTILIIGELVEFHVQDDLVQDDGFIDLSKGNIVAINSLDGYVVTKSAVRFPYQRPNR